MKDKLLEQSLKSTIDDIDKTTKALLTYMKKDDRLAGSLNEALFKLIEAKFWIVNGMGAVQ